MFETIARRPVPVPALDGDRSIAAADGCDAEPAREPDAYDALVREIGEDGASEVRAVFRSETIARLQRFRNLALGEQRAKIEREAHSLKSSARSFGYVRLASLAQKLERSAATLDDDAFRDLVARMDAAFSAALAQEPDD
jgi:HPt (histidine-containing phosphotransfer) domain-containing protein